MVNICISSQRSFSIWLFVLFLAHSCQFIFSIAGFFSPASLPSCLLANIRRFVALYSKNCISHERNICLMLWLIVECIVISCIGWLTIFGALLIQLAEYLRASERNERARRHTSVWCVDLNANKRRKHSSECVFDFDKCVVNHKLAYIFDNQNTFQNSRLTKER